MAESRLDVVINPTRAQSGARAVKSSLDSLKTSWIELTAKIFLAEQAVTRAWKAATAGADFEESLDRLNIQMDRYHSTAQIMINDLKNVSNGQLSNANAAQLASRALMEGLNPDQVKTFTQAADLLGDVMGTDLKTAFDSILQGLATGKTKMLANIGVYVDLEEETKKLALATNRTVDEITKEEKAAIGARAAIEMLDKRMSAFASSMPSEADKLKAMEVRFDDLILKAQRLAKTIVVDIADAFEELDKWMHKTNPFWKANKAVDEATPGNINNPKTQEILGRSIIEDTKANVKRRQEFEAELRKAAANRPMDPKLRMINAEGQHDRNNQQIDFRVNVRNDELDSALTHQRNYVEESLLLGSELLKREKKIALDRIKVQADAIDAKIAEEKRFHKETIGFADTTEAKFNAEQKFQTKMAELENQKSLVREKEYFARFDFNAQIRSSELREEEEKGRRLVESFISTYNVEQDLRHKSQDDALAHFTALQKFQDAYGTSRENQIQTEYDLVRANLAKQLDVTYDTAEKVLNAWRNSDHTHAEELIGETKLTWDQITTIMMNAMADQRNVSEKYSDDFFDGFAKSMKKYVTDQSVFGLGVDQARRVAQGMEQGFQRFFFDAMEGRLKSFKDVIQGITDFAKNLVSQMAATLITNSVLRGITGVMSGGPIGGAVGPTGDVGGFTLREMGGVSRFAEGGISTHPMLRKASGKMNLIGEGKYNEAYVPLPDGRTIPVTMKGMGQVPVGVSVPVKIDIHNEVSGADVQAESRTDADGMQQIKIMIVNAVDDAMKNGRLDKTMGLNFGQTRKPRRRT